MVVLCKSFLQVYLGGYESETTAARAYDRVSVFLVAMIKGISMNMKCSNHSLDLHRGYPKRLISSKHNDWKFVLEHDELKTKVETT